MDKATIYLSREELCTALMALSESKGEDPEVI